MTPWRRHAGRSSERMGRRHSRVVHECVQPCCELPDVVERHRLVCRPRGHHPLIHRVERKTVHLQTMHPATRASDSAQGNSRRATTGTPAPAAPAGGEAALCVLSDVPSGWGPQTSASCACTACAGVSGVLDLRSQMSSCLSSPTDPNRYSCRECHATSSTTPVCDCRGTRQAAAPRGDLLKPWLSCGYCTKKSDSSLRVLGIRPWRFSHLCLTFAQ